MSTKEQRERIELLQGTLDLLILRTLLLGPTHGPSLRQSNSIPRTCCRWSRDRCTRRCTGSSSGDGFQWNKEHRRTTGGCIWRIDIWADFAGNRAAKVRWSHFRNAPGGSETIGAAKHAATKKANTG